MDDPLVNIITNLINPILHFDDLSDDNQNKLKIICVYLLNARKHDLYEMEIQGKFLNPEIIEVLENDLRVTVKVWLGNGDAVLQW